MSEVIFYMMIFLIHFQKLGYRLIESDFNLLGTEHCLFFFFLDMDWLKGILIYFIFDHWPLQSNENARSAAAVYNL